MGDYINYPFVPIHVKLTSTRLVRVEGSMGDELHQSKFKLTFLISLSTLCKMLARKLGA